MAAAGDLLRELGFTGDLVPLDEDTRNSLGLAGEAIEPHIARGEGSLRALVFQIADDGQIRSAVSRLAARLSSRTPHILWLAVGVKPSGSEILVATWDPGVLPPRIVALVAHRGRIVDSDAETICALTAARTASDTLTHGRWLEILGRESVTRRFFQSLRRAVEELAGSLTPLPPQQEAAELALLYASRLLFLSFLETKGWLDADHGFITNRYAECMISGGGYHRRVLAPLFFGTLNTHPRNRAQHARTFGRVPFLNGGLFARSALERRLNRAMFSDESIGDLFANLLGRYRFTAREDSSTWSEAAVDPEMLGKAFESLMAAPERKATGSFYTPQSLVDQLTVSALVGVLSSSAVPATAVAGLLAGEIPPPRLRALILARAGSVRILDPACGSGAFLVHVLEKLCALRVRLGDLRQVYAIRRSILTSSIFGVDVNPTAVWLCELRLWLSMAIENPERDPMRVEPLPNLDRNIRVGDSLAGGAFHAREVFWVARQLTRSRARYSNATGPRKENLARILDRAERACAIEALDARIARLTGSRRDLLAVVRSPDLFGERRSPPVDIVDRMAAVRLAIRDARRQSRALARGAALPFSFQTQFADVGAGGGFDLVIGNPPWVRTHNFENDARARLRRDFWVFRNSAWLKGAKSAAAGSGFGAQVDLAALFIERSIRLARRSGTIALIVPSKLWRSLAGGGVRSYLLQHTVIEELHDLAESRQVFDAAVYPSLVVARREEQPDGAHAEVALTLEASESPGAGLKKCFPDAAASHVTGPSCADEIAQDSSLRDARLPLAFVHRQASVVRWNLEMRSLPLDQSNGSPWILMPPEVRAAFDRVTLAGIALSQTSIGRPLLGVKTGCNEAFVVADGGRGSAPDLTSVTSGARHGDVERSLLRPLVRGDAVAAWNTIASGDRIVWTHDENGAPLRNLPPHARRWLANWRSRLEQRSDARGKQRWWMLFRTESAVASSPRVVWSDIGKIPRAAVLEVLDDTVPLNSCYVARCPDLTDARALAALLNSPLTAAWLNAIAEPARGGYHRYLGWTVSLLPTPADWERARRIMAPIAIRAKRGCPPPAHFLMSAALDAFQLAHSDIEPLMMWSAR